MKCDFYILSHRPMFIKHDLTYVLIMIVIFDLMCIFEMWLICKISMI